MVQCAADRSGVGGRDKAAEKLKYVRFAAAYCSDTSRAQITAKRILDVNEEVGNARPVLVSDMHSASSATAISKVRTCRSPGRPREGPRREGLQRHVAKYGLAATRDFLKEADPFHDAESDAEYWARVHGAFFPDRVQPGSQGRRRRAADIPWQYAAQPHAPLRAGRV